MRTTSAIAAMLITWTTSTLAAAESSPCRNTSDGAPALVRNKASCNMDFKVTKIGEKPLRIITFGIINSASISAHIGLDIDIESIQKYLREHQVRISDLKVDLHITLSNDITLPVSIELEPAIDIAGSGICDIMVTNIHFNVTRFDSTLTDWIDDYVKNYINKNAELVGQAVDAVNAGVRRFQADKCR